MSRLRFFSYVILVLLTTIVVFAAGFGTHWLLNTPEASPLPDPVANTEAAAPTSDQPAFDVFWEAWHILEEEFYGPTPAPQQRTYGAIKGLVQEYGDPYTYFIEPQPRQREREELSGEFGGIGAWVFKGEDGIIRLNPMPDQPAERAGVRKDDIVQGVDGKRVTKETTRDKVVDMIRGPVGESVALALYREPTAETLTIEVVRERIEMPSVEWRILPEDSQTSYAAIHLFSERTARELDRALDDLQEQGAQRMILDLRHNTGGLLQSAVEVASRFLRDGVVLYEQKSDGSEKTYRVEHSQKAPDWPLVILVDGGTASAAEIVAGALQDRGRATLIGERTFGKGSVQLVHDLSDGSSIHVTVAHWLTPNGHEIHEVGLTPDIAVPYQEGRDAPLEEALRYLNSGQATNK